MTDSQDEIRTWMQQEIAARPHGTKGALAAYLGIRPDAITRMANTNPNKETREIKAHELVKMQEFFSQNPVDGHVAQQSVGSTVPLMGYIGAGAEVEPEFEQVPADGLEQIELPFPTPDSMIAFKVKGDSMLPVHRKGSVLIVYKDQRKPLDAFYGQEAAVRTGCGKRYVKTIMRGENGSVNLLSWNASPIENVQLEWIGEIFAILPPPVGK